MRNLGIYASWPSYCEGELYYTQGTHGKWVEEFLNYVDQLTLFAPVANTRGNTLDYTIKNTKIKVIPLPFYSRYIEGVRHFNPIRRHLRNFGTFCDAFYINFPNPFVWLISQYFPKKALLYHMLGDPFQTLQENKSYSKLKRLVLCGCFMPEWIMTRRALKKHLVIMEGYGVYEKYRHLNSNSEPVISTTLIRDDFWERTDTCQNDTIRLLYVGFLRGSKGLDVLLEAFATLQEKYPIYLVMVGDGEYRTALEKQVCKMGITEKVSFKGYVGQGALLNKEYRMSDIFVFPSFSEGGPRVLLEAMANSLPVVTTRVGYVPKLIKNGVHAVTVETKNLVALAKAVEKFIEDGNLRRSCIKNGYEFAFNYRLETFIKSIVNRLNLEIHQIHTDT